MIRILIAISLYLCWAAPAQAAERSPRVEVRGEWLYVDGEPFVVKGVGYSPARPGQLPWASPVSAEVMAEDFRRIREAGFNTLRTWASMSPEQLTLAGQHGLMVLQGIWVDRKGHYTSEMFQRAMFEAIQREVERAKASDNVLGVLVGNELLPERAFLAGLAETDGLFQLAYRAAKRVDPQRLVSYANWPQLSALDMSFWDVISFNLYPYEPRSVSQSFGFRGYVEYLKRTVAADKPLVITELGLSVSPRPGPRPGYGGFTPEAQARDVVKLWNDVFEAGAQGACVFEWNDEWWKQAEYSGDERTHDESDPEEWFGLTEFTSADQISPQPRPLYEALKAYNQAVLISPVSGQSYQERIPVSVYVTEAVSAVRFRVGGGKWRPATKVSEHWWKAQVPVKASQKPQSVRFAMEARDAQGKPLVQQERVIWFGPPEAGVTVTIETNRGHYQVGAALEPMRYTVRVATDDNQPLAGLTVDVSIAEPQAKTELVRSIKTDAEGKAEGVYMLREPGLITLAAGTAPDPRRPERRVGAELSVAVSQLEEAPTDAGQPPHQPSEWESRIPEDLRQALHPRPAFALFDPGADTAVDYAKYGTFHDVGTAQYRYEILDREGLAAAVGEGVYPNEQGLLRDPAYRKALQAEQLEGLMWDFTYHPDPQLAFFKWAGSTEESDGVRQFFTGMALERAGLLLPAVKAYYAVMVHFPETVGWTEFKTPWYVGVVARDKIESILRLHPELGLRLEGADITVEGGFDNVTENDKAIVNPGRLVADGSAESAGALRPVDLAQIGVKRETGKGRVRLRQYANGHWQLLVDGKPWTVHGLSYQPSAVGESPDEGTLKDWMTADRNGNGKIDGPYDTFVDANTNNRQDPDEPAVGDFQLLKEMGVNTVRLYHHASNKALLRELYDRYRIMVLMGDLVGMYTVGSGAAWEKGTDYLDPEQRTRMTESVKQMVREFKDEPYVLMWVLGNENNYGGVHGLVGGVGNASQLPEEYYSFLNELAEWIHQEDPDHPVAIANGEWLFLDVIARVAPAIDVFGANVYRGSHGFGRSLFSAVRAQLDKPVLITEFGCPAYQKDRPREAAEVDQALYHLGNWIDLEDNMAGRGVGNALGGVVFAWVDEWWKAGQPPRFSPIIQETTPNWSGPFPGGKMFEEWLGVTSQGDGSASPYLRQLRKAYRLYQRLWNS